MNYTPQSYAAFLESLKVNNDRLEEMHGWNFTDDPQKIWKNNVAANERFDFIEYLLERCRRAESNAKSSDLAEQVKAFMRAGMDAQSKSDNAMEKEGQYYWDEVSDEFRRLSEPGEG